MLSLALVITAVMPFSLTGPGLESAHAALQPGTQYREKFGVNMAHLKLKDIPLVYG